MTLFRNLLSRRGGGDDSPKLIIYSSLSSSVKIIFYPTTNYYTVPSPYDTQSDEEESDTTTVRRAISKIGSGGITDPDEPIVPSVSSGYVNSGAVVDKTEPYTTTIFPYDEYGITEDTIFSISYSENSFSLICNLENIYETSSVERRAVALKITDITKDSSFYFYS
jgi:hypothetical protein